MTKLRTLGLGVLLAISIAAIATPGADLDSILQNHEDRITALESVPSVTTTSSTVSATTTTTLPPTTSTTSPPPSTPTTGGLPANGVVTCNDCVLDGGGLTYPIIDLNGQRNVTVTNAVVKGDPGGALQSGTVNIRDASFITVRDIIVLDSPRSCFSVEHSNDINIDNVECWNPEHLGVHGGFTSNVTVQNSLIVGSSQRNTDIGWESGGLKLVLATNLRVLNNEIRDGFGPGIWFDIDVNGGLIQGNTITNQSAEGIFVEISRNVEVRNNSVTNSPTGLNSSRMNWLYGSGILVSTSTNVDVLFNVVDGSYHGITVIDQCNRADRVPNHDASQYLIQDNVVSNVNKVGAAQDCGSTAVFFGKWVNNTWNNVREFVWSSTPPPF